jgi:hypothetical protein
MPAYSRIEGTVISYQKYHADTNDEVAKIYNIDFPVQAIFYLPKVSYTNSRLAGLYGSV